MNPMFYFLIAFTAVLAATANAGGKVLDVEGAPVFNSSYYLRPLSDGRGGGLALSPRGDNECPLYIGQDPMGYRGIPVIFSHWLLHIDYIYESVDLSIKMDVEATTCAQPTYWSDPTPRTVFAEFIVAGPKPLNGSFQIKNSEKVIGGYNIVFCPKGTDCSYARKVGIFLDRDGVHRLALSFTPFLRPFEFVLVKANGTETSSQTMSII
ncbi:hypothetical protein N665_0476s0020 [Sinapis alba]|nr:hypothetical protein N665_0476s0020 [Sinapis alba]